MDVRGKFGEHEKSVRVVRGAAKDKIVRQEFNISAKEINFKFLVSVWYILIKNKYPPQCW